MTNIVYVTQRDEFIIEMIKMSTIYLSFIIVNFINSLTKS